MLSRVADSLYWMSRYFERADHCARVLDATHNLMLNPAKISTEQRWYRALTALAPPSDAYWIDPQQAMLALAAGSGNRSSMVACISAARENAGQVREEISSEVWEQLNRLFHEVTQGDAEPDPDDEVMRLVRAVRQGSHLLHGVADGTMNHGEGWHFIQLGKYHERASCISVLLDAYFTTDTPASDLDWIGLLTSCVAFESYCKVYTADLKPEQIAEFLLLNDEFPYSVRYSAERMRAALQAIAKASLARQTNSVDRLSGRLCAILAYAQIEDVMRGDLHRYLTGVLEQCHELHAALHAAYIDYPVEAAFAK